MWVAASGCEFCPDSSPTKRRHSSWHRQEIKVRLAVGVHSGPQNRQMDELSPTSALPVYLTIHLEMSVFPLRTFRHATADTFRLPPLSLGISGWEGMFLIIMQQKFSAHPVLHERKTPVVLYLFLWSSRRCLRRVKRF